MALNEYLSNPGLWVIVGLFAIACINFASALTLKAKVRKLARLTEELRKEEGFNATDQAWLRNYLDIATGNIARELALSAPLFAFVAPVAIFKESNVFSSKSHKEALEILDREILEEEVQILKNHAKVDVAGAAFWTDARRSEIASLAESVQTARHPFLSIWSAIWLTPTLLITIVTLILKHMVAHGKINARQVFRPLIDTIRSRMILRMLNPS